MSALFLLINCENITLLRHGAEEAVLLIAIIVLQPRWPKQTAAGL